MSLKLGIVGLPNVGKSTLFQALTKKQVDTSNYPFATIDPNVGVVAVPDIRLQKLTELSHSKKTIPATIEFTDIAGLVKGAHEGEGLGNKFLSHIREVDAIVEVVRVFMDTNVHHVAGAIDPEEDVGVIHTELILADLSTAEKALARMEKEARSGGSKEKVKLERLQSLHKLLSEGKLASQWEQTEDDIPLLTELQLLTKKPIIVLLNTADPESEKTQQYLENFKEYHPIALNIKIED
jgi:ribosome-binding ATPase